MRDNHTREGERRDGMQGLKVVAGGVTTVEGGRGAVILYSTAASNESVNDWIGGQWSGQRTTKQGKTQQSTIDEGGKGEQWLATARVRGQ